MSSRVARFIAFLTVLGSLPFARTVQGQYASPPAGQSDPTALRAAVDAANRRFESAFNRGDAAGAARGFYSRDARILPPGSATVQGVEKIAAYWAAAATAPETGVRRVQLATLDLQPVGDAAYEIGQATLTLANGQRVTPRYFIVWQREDGVWRRYLDIWNMDTN
jgi:ketosteroid isomerase-like protein